MKDKIFSVLQRVGRSFMLPIAILPVAGLFLGIGGSFTNPTTIATYGLTSILGEGTILNALLVVMTKSGEIVFANLPIIFAMGVAIGMAKKEKEVAALSGAIAFFVMHTAISALIQVTKIADKLPNGSITSVVGIQSLQMGVFGGIIVGLGVAYLHNKYYKIELPQVLSFFGGTRFVPIVSAIAYLIVGILMFFIWPTVQQGIYAVGEVVRGSGYAGTFIYGVMERALIPFGLHHVFYIPFWQTSVGGTAQVCGQLVEGAQNIFFAELACPQTAVFNVEATRFMSGKFPLMIFGLPGAALAMYHMAKSNKKKIVGGLLLSAALTSLLTGITEPIEFTFLFVAPLLYIIHVVGAGLAYMLMHILKVGVGMTFSGGAIDLTLFGILQGNAKTNWLMIVLAGIGYFAVYYFVFKFLIQKLNLKTPGREDDNEETKLYTRQDVEQKQNDVSKIIVEGLGGKDNISDVDNCITRLRMTVHDPSKVDEEVLKQSGCKGVVCKGPGVQIIFGPRAANIKSELEEYLHHSPNTKATNVFMPITGRLAPISETPDETFAQEMMGKGICIFPTENVVYSPVNGTISMVFPTKHALGIISDEGVEILVHVGIDTVTLNGEAFEVFVQQGDKVVANQKLIEFDLAMINEKATSSATPIVFTNLNGHDIEVVKLGDVKAKEVILKLK